MQQLRQCRLGFDESRFHLGGSGRNGRSSGSGVGGGLGGGAVGRTGRVGSTSGASGLVCSACSGLIACGGGDLVELRRFGRCGRRHGGQSLADRSRDSILRLRPRLFLFGLHGGTVLRSLLINGCGLFSGLVLGLGIRALAISGLGSGLLILVILADGGLALGGLLQRFLSVRLGRLALRGIVPRCGLGFVGLVSFDFFVGLSLVSFGTGLIVHRPGGLLVGLRRFGRCGRRHGGQSLADRSRDGILRLRPRLFLFGLHGGTVLRSLVRSSLDSLRLLLGCLALLLRRLRRVGLDGFAVLRIVHGLGSALIGFIRLGLARLSFLSFLSLDYLSI